MLPCILTVAMLSAMVTEPAELRVGAASWYGAAPSKAAAGPALRIGNWRNRIVLVCSKSNCIRVRLTDWCQCYKGTSRERVIDLPRSDFAKLAHPSKGLVRVKVVWP